MGIEEVILLLVCLGFIITTLLIKTKGDFFLGTKNNGIIKTTLSLAASWIGVTSILVVSTWIFELGPAAIWYHLSPSICLIFMGLFFVKKIRKTSQPQIAEYFNNQNIKLILLVFIGVFYFLILTAQIIGFAIISQTFNIPYLFGLILCCVTIIFYVGVGGFNAVSTTDMLQAALIFITIIGLLFTVDLKIDHINLAKAFNPLNLNNRYMLFFLYFGLIMFIGQENHQRIKAAKSERVASISLILFGIITILFTLSIYLLSVSIGKQEINSIVYFIQQSSVSWRILFTVGLLGASLSTSDTALNISASSFATLIGNKRANLWIIIITITLLSGLIAYFLHSIALTITIAFNFYFSVMFPLIFLHFTKLSNGINLRLVILISFLTFIVGLLIDPINSGLYGSVLTFLSLLLYKLFIRAIHKTN